MEKMTRESEAKGAAAGEGRGRIGRSLEDGGVMTAAPYPIGGGPR